MVKLWEWCPEQRGRSIDSRDYGATACIKNPGDDFCISPPALWPCSKHFTSLSSGSASVKWGHTSLHIKE